MSATTPVLDIQDIMREVRKRARIGSQARRQTSRRFSKSIPTRLGVAVACLKNRPGALREGISRIGELPPSPDSWRARMGAIGVHLVRRSLFWLIPPLKASHEQMVAVMEEQIFAAEELLKALEHTTLQVENLRESMESVEFRLSVEAALTKENRP